MGNHNFVADRKIGWMVEDWLVKKLEARGNEVIKKNDTAEYDILLKDKGGRTTTVEVKSDFIAWRTGRAFLEYNSYGRPSGIDATEADLWAYVVRNKVFIFAPSRVNLLLRQEFFHDVVTTERVGDPGSETWGFFLPCHLLETWSDIVLPYGWGEMQDGPKPQ